MSAGNFHNCALREGVPTCWGGTREATISPPDGLFRAVVAGAWVSCGLEESGAVSCWGEGALQPELGDDLVNLVGGGFHVCALTTSAALRCTASQTPPPDGLPEMAIVPVDISSEGIYLEVTAGLYHVCALRKDAGEAVAECWGKFSRNAPPLDEPAEPPPGPFTHLCAGAAAQHVCATRPDGAVACWGNGTWAQDEPPAGGFERLSCGAGHTCGIRAGGEIECWGGDDWGMASPPAGPFVDVTSGIAHSCGIRPAGNIECWGAGLGDEEGWPHFDQGKAPR